MPDPDDAAFPAAEIPPPGTPMWHVREALLPRNRWRFRTIGDDTHPDSTVVDGPVDTRGAFEYGRSDIDARGRSVILINPAIVPDAPQLWFVVLPERNSHRSAMTLVAFATGHLPPGTVVSDPEFFSLPVDSSEQAGAIRWWHEDAVVDQIFVAEQWRRCLVGRAALAAAQTFQVHNGWPARLTSDGRRTSLGERFATGALFPDRYAPLETLSPGMDPPKGA